MATESIVVSAARPVHGLVSGPLVRPVRIGMTVNGTDVGQRCLKSFSYTSKSYFSAAEWRAVIALDGTPTGFGAPYWSSEPSVEISLLASLTTGRALVPVMGGFVDTANIDLESQEMTINGRDYSAALIDAISNDKWSNQTSSGVANILAQRRGLTPQVTATSTPVGRYFTAQTDYMAEDISEWRILTFLAEQEGFDLYTSGKTLVFAPAKEDSSPLHVQYAYAPKGGPISANAPAISMQHRKVLAGTTTVQVRSYQYQNKQAVISTWVSKKQAPAAGGSGPTATMVTRSQAQSGSRATGPFYIYRRSGLTQQQADQYAQNKLAEITSHEREVTYNGPGILGITARRSLQLSGTGTAFDMVYPVKTAEVEFSWRKGCCMEVVANNGSQSEAERL